MSIVFIIVLVLIGVLCIYLVAQWLMKSKKTGGTTTSGGGNGSSSGGGTPTPTFDAQLGVNNPNAYYTKSNIYVCHSKIDSFWYVMVADLVKDPVTNAYSYGSHVPNTYYIMYTAASGAAAATQAAATTFAQSSYDGQTNIKIYSTDGNNSLFTNYELLTPVY